MKFFMFLVQVVIISMSGVMAPGPMSAVTIGKGSRSRHAGAFISIGHGLVEMPLIIALMFGIGAFVEFQSVKIGLEIAGGAILTGMGIGMLQTVNKITTEFIEDKRSPIVAGILLSAGNPYFLIWWATIGITLITRASRFGASGIITFALVHWICDFIWLWFLSLLSYRGGRFFGNIFQKAAFIICGLVLIGFGVKFFWDALKPIVF